jgi:N-acetylmuramoyl-L-alanine amidase
LFLLLALVLPVAGAQPSLPQASKPADWLDLATAAAGWKAILSYDPMTGSGHILKGVDLVRFKTGLPIYAAGPVELLHVPAIRDRGVKLEMPASTHEAISRWFEGREKERASHFSIAAILMDPGHGGKDPGAIGEFGVGKDRFRVKEKDIVLAISNDVYTRLQARWPDKRILTTRSDDTFPSLDARVEMANDVQLGTNEAIIYISIHANASFNKNASGFEVWYLDPEYRRSVVDPSRSKDVDAQVLPILNAMLEEEYTTESMLLAKGILGGLKTSVGEVSLDRGLREEEWFVVKNAKMPSVLVEVGFVTNEAEARLLADGAHLRKLGDGIYNGIVEFIDYFEHRKGFVSP